MAHLVDARAHHLRLAAQAVRVLHAVAVDVRRADVALREQVAVERRGFALAAMTANVLDAGIERGVAAEARVDRHRAGDERGGQRALRREHSGERQRRRHLRAVEQREPLLGHQLERFQARRGERVGARQHAPADARLALADQHRREMRERRQVARRADRPLRRNARHDAGVRDVHDQVDDFPAHARVPARERRGLQRHDEPDRRVVEQRPRSRAVRAHERALQLGQPRVVDARAREEAEAGVDAVDGIAAREDLRNRRGRGVHARLRRRVDGESRSVGPDRAQRPERKARRREQEHLHAAGRARRPMVGDRMAALYFVDPNAPTYGCSAA